MIRIGKPPNTPIILLKQGADQTREDKAAYDNDPGGYRSGKHKFQANNRIYGDKSVKLVLLSAQHGKCCYCEAKFGATSYGDVEHYRPKGAVKQGPGLSIEYPGYYWLAYDWDNLLVSCTVCNRNKSSLFPLVDETARACSHHDDIEKEQPLFINPARDDPREHIYFRGEEPIPITELGRGTIKGLNLRRDDLQECRRTCLGELKILQDLIVVAENSSNPDMQDPIKRAKEQLKTAISPETQFSSMMQDFLGS